MARDLLRNGGVKMGRKFEDERALRETLERLYFEEGCSLPTIARILHVNYRTVWRWFEKFGIPRRTLSDAISLALSSIYNRPYDPSKDENTVIELNALYHTDFTCLYRNRKVRIHSGTSRIGQIQFFNKIITSHNLMPVRCAPTWSKTINYQWLIYTHLDETFKGVFEKDKIRYLESLKDDREALLLYFTRVVECDGWIEIVAPSSALCRKRICAYIGFAQKDHQYVQRLAEIISETFNVPVTVRYYKKDLTKLYLPMIDERVKDLLYKMPMVHPERNLKRDLALRCAGEVATEDLLREINNARSVIRQLRDLTVELARERHLLDMRKRAMAADKLVEEVLRRYAERYNDYYYIERYYRI
ncbi:MAG: hypothetical protein LZ169_04585 [Thaumarchaeota archaeon]|jgi:hypothetical protein|nr:hypothetical protein [Candidatus Wolframiiraptor allenii]